jgi:hypothetical protein
MSWCTERYAIDPKYREYKKRKSAAWYANNKERRRDYQLQKNFGISAENYAEIFEEQGNGCAICSKEQGVPYHPVDHDHGTGEVRGILCTPCNTGLGMFQDDIKLLLKAKDYLDGKG